MDHTAILVKTVSLLQKNVMTKVQKGRASTYFLR